MTEFNLILAGGGTRFSAFIGALYALKGLGINIKKIRSPKHEIRSKSECSNIQNSKTRYVVESIYCFDSLEFWSFDIVSDFGFHI